MTSGDQVFWLSAAGLSVLGWLALRGRVHPMSTQPLPATLPTGSYWSPVTRATPGEIDARVTRLTAGWVWPVEREPSTPWRTPVVSDTYRRRPQRWHQGVDIMYKRDTALPRSQQTPDRTRWHDMWPGVHAIATGPGIVVASGRIKTGGRVRIDHGGGLTSAYLHLDKVAVRKGDRVRRGQTIGTIGIGSGVRHMHYELWQGWLHKPLDPSSYLPQWGYARRATS